MLSRVAETIYWMGRYLERAENTARLINVNTNLIIDLPKGVTPGWEPLIRILGGETAYAERHDEFTERRVVNFLISDETNPGSILSTFAYARKNARTIREILPREAWEQLNAFYQSARDNKQTSYARQGRQEYLSKVIENVQQHIGLMAGTMNHNIAYKFLNLGRKLERSEMTTRILNVQSDNPVPDEMTELDPFQDMLWMSMLKSLSAYQMYRQSMQTRINRIAVLTFLLHNEEFPRSLAYCIENMAYNLTCLPNSDKPLQVLRYFEQTIDKASMSEMDNEILHGFIDQLQICLGSLHDTIAKTYFPALTEQPA